MRKVFLDELPRGGRYIKKNSINWKESIGSKVKFVYDDIEGEIEIVDYKNSYLTVKYENKTKTIKRDNFLNCRLGELLNKYTKEFKYNIGKHIKDDKRDFTITDREYREVKEFKRTYNYKFYKYHCHKCNGEHWMTESGINRGSNCIFCSNKKELLGFNTIYDKASWMIKLGISEEDAKKYTPQSNEYINVTCPHCKKKKKVQICQIYKNKSIGCSCGDGISYPEKFTFKLLEQLNIDFIWQYTKINAKWCDSYKYDFYFEYNNEEYIIEVHGLQHYEESKNYMSLDKNIENDKLKYNLAINNRIKPDNYIAIDFRESTLEWGKEHIMTSKLNELFDLSKMDWNKCDEYALKNIVKEVCDYWHEHKEINKENVTPEKIGNIFNLEKSTIRNYLHKGTKLNWCKYTGNKNKVLIYDLDMNYIGCEESTNELDRKSIEKLGIHLDYRNISAVCRGKLPHYKGYIFKYAD